MTDLDARAQQAITVAEWLLEHGPPVRVRDLARVTGFSKGKFYADIERGRLEAYEVKTGQTIVYTIARAEAVRYLAAIGFGRAA
jgi:hypothetical protein